MTEIQETAVVTSSKSGLTVGDRQFSEWNWLAPSTTAAIAAGRIGVNNDQPSQATEVRLHRLDQRNLDWGDVMALMDKGDRMRLQTGNQATSWHRYVLTGKPVAQADNWLIPVVTDAGSPPGTEPANGVGLKGEAVPSEAAPPIQAISTTAAIATTAE